MRVLGIDPGSVVTGYGVVECRGRSYRLVTCGCLRPDPKLAFSRRLVRIYDGLMDLVAEVGPEVAAVEATFYGAKVQTLMKMCHARGAIMVALANSDLPVHEYSPREVKKAVVGRGGASKEQVRFMVQKLLGVDTLPDGYDTTDSLAVAVCHGQRPRVLESGGPQKKSSAQAKLEVLMADTESGSGSAYARILDRVGDARKVGGRPVKLKRRGR